MCVLQGESTYGASVLGAPPRRGGDAAATAAEVKQKAAKMLHAGTQWFMKASKTLVRDLQTSMAKHQQHGEGRLGGVGCGYGDSEAYLALGQGLSRRAGVGPWWKQERRVLWLAGPVNI